MSDLERMQIIALTILEKTTEPVKVKLSDIIGVESAIDMQIKKEKEIVL